MTWGMLHLTEAEPEARARQRRQQIQTILQTGDGRDLMMLGAAMPFFDYVSVPRTLTPFGAEPRPGLRGLPSATRSARCWAGKACTTAAHGRSARPVFAANRATATICARATVPQTTCTLRSTCLASGLLCAEAVCGWRSIASRRPGPSWSACASPLRWRTAAASCGAGSSRSSTRARPWPWPERCVPYAVLGCGGPKGGPLLADPLETRFRRSSNESQGCP